MLKIVFSIPIHEKLEVVIDQVNNIKKYVKHPYIVFHASRGKFTKEELNRLMQLEDVYVNPNQYETGWGSILHTHISNFWYMCSVVDFDYFVMQSSNDMYVRSGIEDYISGKVAGFHIHRIVKDSLWWPSEVLFLDEMLKDILKYMGSNEVIATQVEGSFYSKELMKKTFELIGQFYDRSKETIMYPREEVYIPTVALHLLGENKGELGYSTTFSDVHRFDRKFFICKRVLKNIYLPVSRFIPKSIYDFVLRKFEMFYYYFADYRITKRVVDKIAAGDKKIVDSNRFLNDGKVEYQLYEENKVFSVKRVKREYSDKIRTYIRQL